MDIGLTSQLFLEHPGYSDLRTVLGSRDQEKLQCAVLKQDWTGIPEYGEEFYRVHSQSLPYSDLVLEEELFLVL